MTISALGSVVLVVGLLTLTPGLDTALIVRTAGLRTPARAWGVVSGIQSGTLIWGALTSAGVTALLTASHTAYEVVRWAGVAYLAWMGARMLWSALRAPDRHDVALTNAAPDKSEMLGKRSWGAAAGSMPVGGLGGTAAVAEPGGSAGVARVGGPGAARDFARGWRRGLATNLLNPKMGAFYVALLPQFIPAGANPLRYGILLAGIHVVLGLAWSTVLIVAARGMRRLLRRPAARRVTDAVTGTVVVGFGVRLATSSH
jgi:threonine/homoserine/homoserine lactone efflux protein